MISEPKNKPDTRHLVYQVICAVDEKNFPLDQALEDCFSKTGDLDPRDRAFIKNLATTLFRHLAFIDKHISSFLKRPLQKRALWVRHWLRIGAAQILFLDVPDHAAVNTSVDAVGNSKRSGAKVFRGLTNGVLRNVIRGKERILADLEKNPDGILPRWIKGRWSDFYGEKTVSKICRVLKTQPPLDISLKDPGRAESLARDLSAEEIYPGTLRFRPKGPITTLPGFRDGDWWAQDLAASLPPRLLGDVKGKRVLDLCAAPGGKTLFLAAQGAIVTAVDISKTRIERVK
ncbi:MAG: transcription antitermination factor NusB, partial [Alphaproteobacteria bacterium]